MKSFNSKKNYYYNDKDELVEELVEGKYALDFLYNTFWGKIFKRFFASRLAANIYGWCQNSRCSKKKIFPFIQKHHINMNDFIQPTEGYANFNKFFYRQLKPNARPIDPGFDSIIAPADSKLFVIKNLAQTEQFFIKSDNFNLVQFFDCSLLAQQFEGGTMMIFRLAPPDYHHFHFPCDCTPTKTREFGSDYESVNPVSFKAGFQPLAKNVRHLYILETEKFDRVAMVAVGAMFVGHIVKTFTPEKQYAKGDDAGYFEFGGSTVVLVFKKGTIEPLEQFVKHSEEGIETQVKVGQVVARKV